MGVCAVENSMLLILDIISLTQITGREGPGVPCCGLKTKGVDTQSETGNTVNDIFGKYREMCGKAVGRTSSQSLFWGQCTPSIISENFAVVLSWAIIIGWAKLQVSLSEVHNKTTEINEITVPQLFLEHILFYQTSHG